MAESIVVMQLRQESIVVISELDMVTTPVVWSRQQRHDGFLATVRQRWWLPGCVGLLLKELNVRTTLYKLRYL